MVLAVPSLSSHDEVVASETIADVSAFPLAFRLDGFQVDVDEWDLRIEFRNGQTPPTSLAFARELHDRTTDDSLGEPPDFAVDDGFDD
jgi:hypothetical protein